VGPEDGSGKEQITPALKREAGSKHENSTKGEEQHYSNEPE
jgi:hypothetical protein